MSAVFVSYRNAFADLHTRLIAKELGRRIKPHVIFSDQTIPSGQEYPKFLREKLREARLILLVIHGEWKVAGPKDWVRQEIEIGLEMNKLFLPVLVRGAQLPKKLPPSVERAFHFEAFSFGGDMTWDRDPDWDRLAKDIKRLLEPAAQAQPKFDPRPGCTLPLVLALACGIALLGGLIGLLWVLRQ